MNQKGQYVFKHLLLFLVGIIISFISFGTLFLIEYSELNYQLNIDLSLSILIKSASYCLIIAIFEEIIFRYLFLYKWLRNTKKTYSSKVLYLGIISSIVFGFLHLELTLFPKLQILLTLAGGSLFYGVYKLRSIGLAIGMHFSWNLIQGVILPFNGSGTSVESIFIIKNNLEVWPENNNYMIISILIEVSIIYCLSRTNIFKIK